MQVSRLLMAVLVVAGLGAGLVYTIMSAGEGGGPTPILAAAPTSTAGSAGSATVTLPMPVPAMASEAVPATPVPARIVTSTTSSPPPVVVALREALTAWGQFAITGRVRDLGDHFVAGGPQRRQLRAEAESIRATTPGGPPYVVTTGHIFTISVTPTDVVLRTEIQWARQAEATQSFIWDIHMRLVDGRWQLLTVDEVDEEARG